MRYLTLYSLFFSFFAAIPAFATELDSSLGLALAKRAAAMENSRDLPSRAVWLTNRAVKNEEYLALRQAKTKSPKKRSLILKN